MRWLGRGRVVGELKKINFDVSMVFCIFADGFDNGYSCRNARLSIVNQSFASDYKYIIHYEDTGFCYQQ